jgi:hypothetical protein
MSNATNLGDLKDFINNDSSNMKTVSDDNFITLEAVLRQ